MTLNDIHLNIFNILQLRISKEPEADTASTSRILNKPCHEPKGQEDVITTSLRDGVWVADDTGPDSQDYEYLRHAHERKRFNTLITYNFMGREHEMIQPKGIYVDLYA